MMVLARRHPEPTVKTVVTKLMIFCQVIISVSKTIAPRAPHAQSLALDLGAYLPTLPEGPKRVGVYLNPPKVGVPGQGRSQEWS